MLMVAYSLADCTVLTFSAKRAAPEPDETEPFKT